MLSKNGEIRRDDGCLDYSGGESVIVYPCHGQKGNQEWQYREVSIGRAKQGVSIGRAKQGVSIGTAKEWVRIARVTESFKKKKAKD